MKVNYSLLFVAILVGIFLIVFAISLQKFDKGSDSEVVKVYYVDNISQSHQKIIDKFNLLHQGKIEVVPIDIPFHKFSTNERKELLIGALRSNSERVDIFAADIIWISRFARWAENLDKYFSEDEKNALTSCAKITGHVNDNFLASPLYLDASVMFYRKDLLQKMGNFKSITADLDNSITWEKFIGLSNNIKNKNQFYIYPADAYEGLVCSYMELVLTQNEDFFNSGIDLTNEQSEKALQLLVDIVNKYKISPRNVVNYREKDAYDDFIENNGLFVRGWQSFENDTKNLNKGSELEKFITFTQLPHFEGTQPGSTIGGWNLMLAQSSQHKEEAIKFIKYTLTKESQKILFSEGAYLPVINSLYTDSSFISENPKIKFGQKILSTGKFRPKLEDYTKISDILSKYISMAINDEISVKTALLNAETQINITRRNH